MWHDESYLLEYRLPKRCWKRRQWSVSERVTNVTHIYKYIYSISHMYWTIEWRLNDLQQRCRWTECIQIWPAEKGPASADVWPAAYPADSYCFPLEWPPAQLTSPQSPVYNLPVPTETAVLPTRAHKESMTIKWRNVPNYSNHQILYTTYFKNLQFSNSNLLWGIWSVSFS